MWGYSNGLNELFKYETELNESTLQYIIDTTFPIPKEEDDGIITVDDVISEPITDGFMAETAVDESEVFDDFNIEDTINTVDEDNSLSDESFDIFEEELITFNTSSSEK